MSLDQNLFTLLFTQNKTHPSVIDLVDPSGTVHYHKRRVPGSEYKIEVYDPLSEALLITATAPTPQSKVKTLELYNPTLAVEIKYTGTLSFRWSFRWEEHDFEWKREECYLLRKPDPPVLVAVTKEPTGRLKTSQVQLLDYNLNRFDIDDRKGLEIVILTSLMTFQDANEAYHLPPESSASATPSRKTSGNEPVATRAAAAFADVPPPPPPKPAPKTGVDRIAEMQAMKGDYNEILVEDEGSVQDYAQYCCNLLQDDAMLFISVKSSTAEFVPKVLQVVEETKRIRYKAGLDDDDEPLHQYVLYDIEKKQRQSLYDTERKRALWRINLNDGAEQLAEQKKQYEQLKKQQEQKNKYDQYAPPDSLTVHLSKIDMPELQPKSQPSTIDKGKKKEDNKQAAPSIPIPPAPSSSSNTTSNPFSSSTSSTTPSTNNKPPKVRNKLARLPRDPSPKPKKPSPPSTALPSPTTGALNTGHSSGQRENNPSSAPSFPVPTIPSHTRNSSRGYETPGLSHFNMLSANSLPNSPFATRPPPSTPSYSGSGSVPVPPPPPPSTLTSGIQPPQRPLSTAQAVAQNVVSGIFDMLNHHRK